MDRFLDEQENPAPVRERSASPNITSLIYGDPKRQHIELEAALEMVQKVVGNTSAVFSPLKLHPDLQPATTEVCTPPTTTVSINPDPREGQQSTENMVHIANFTSSLRPTPGDDIANGLIEPSPKRMKIENEPIQQTVEQTVPTQSDSVTRAESPPAGKTAPPQETAENGSHVNNVEVSISSVSNSVHSLVDGSLTASPLPSEALPARPTEPVAQ